ncbi:MAG TPA: AAA family ATPase, partial [Herpetosiphonaceae bacterium]|nr:AAA family ATPase [Herpetosiphonaceae bacterium]
MTGSSTLPRYATRLIGRAQSTGALSELLLRPDIRLVTMIGASGTGKTRLGLQVAETLGEHFCDGQYFVALASVTNPRFVMPAVAQALEVKEGGRVGLQASVAERLNSQKVLLILDNFEQVRAAAGMVEGLLEQTSDVKILVTSQMALGSDREHIFEVPPLAYPGPGEEVAPERLLDYSAVALFVDRLQTVQPRFRLTAEHARPIIEICRLVQGLPLAIELIA